MLTLTLSVRQVSLGKQEAFECWMSLRMDDRREATPRMMSLDCTSAAKVAQLTNNSNRMQYIFQVLIRR
jgi:hypothetical protein